MARWSCSRMLFGVFDLPDLNAGFVLRVVAFDRRRVGAAFVDRDLLTGAVLSDRLA